MGIVAADVTALLGTDVLDRELLVPDTVMNRLAKRTVLEGMDGHHIYSDNWFVPMYRAPSSHVYVYMDLSATVHFTRTQLSKLHQQFFHPFAQKLFNFLRRERPDDATPETLRSFYAH